MIFQNVVLVASFLYCITDRSFHLLIYRPLLHVLYQDTRGWITQVSAIYLSRAISWSKFNRPLCIEVYLLLKMVYLLLWIRRDWIVGCVYGQWTQWTLWDQLVFSGPWNIMFVYLRREFILLIHCFALLWGLKGFDFLLIYLLHFFFFLAYGASLYRKHLLQLRSPLK